MIRPPAFWRCDGVLPRLLSPLAAAMAAATARRLARPGWRAPVPVICCGNVTVGGAGKTTLALDLGSRLIARGHAVHFLLRGYGGAVRGPHRVVASDTAARVGDEALLLAALAPTWVGADRAASARAAVAAGAHVLVMDDGLQNPGLHKDLSLLVVDGTSGFGNGRVLPAGPLREPVAAAARRCQAAVLIGPDETGIAASLRLAVMRARLEPGAEIATWIGRRVLAFAGIARPGKFFTMLAGAGVIVAGTAPFPDHYRFTRRDLDRLLAGAARLGAAPLTTPKDAVRLPAAYRDQIGVVGVSLAWDDPAALDALVARHG
ncbi:MAG TPA: tetraacyldisaccharide 4'-kinase [Acetobacteraceae bacterium]|jgi:tetraacyldisaccharide 4'-kinase